MVTGIGGPAGRNVALLLLEKGHTVIGVDMQKILLPGVKVHRIPPASHPSFLEKLYILTVEESIQLLIPTVSEELPILASEWKKWSDIPAVIGQYQAVSDADDKFLTYKRLSSHRVCVPRYLLPSQVLRLRRSRLIWDWLYNITFGIGSYNKFKFNYKYYVFKFNEIDLNYVNLYVIRTMNIKTCNIKCIN